MSEVTEPLHISRGAVVEFGLYWTFGVTNLVISDESILLETDAPSRYRWVREEVDAVLYTRPPWGLFRFYTVRMVDGSRPEVFFVTWSSLLRALQDRGWRVEIHQRWTPRVLIPERIRKRWASPENS